MATAARQLAIRQTISSISYYSHINELAVPVHVTRAKKQIWLSAENH